MEFADIIISLFHVWVLLQSTAEGIGSNFQAYSYPRQCFYAKKNQKVLGHILFHCHCVLALKTCFSNPLSQFVHVQPWGSFLWIIIAAIFKSKAGLATTSKPHFPIIMEAYLRSNSANTPIFVKQAFVFKQAQISSYNLFSELSEFLLTCAFIWSYHSSNSLEIDITLF